ncbi:unnamed protein product [Phaeothamnion confervicola]
MLIAMSEDWRVLVVKLADRLHNMRTIAAMPLHKQRRIARETMDVFVPLAHRLGLWGIKCELEDLCFAVLQPVEYDRVRRLVEGREQLTQHTPALLEATRAMLEEELQRAALGNGGAAAAGSSSGGSGTSSGSGGRPATCMAAANAIFEGMEAKAAATAAVAGDAGAGASAGVNGNGAGAGPRLGMLRVEVHQKPLYRIWRAMQRNGSNFYAQLDVVSFRIVFNLAQSAARTAAAAVAAAAAEAFGASDGSASSSAAGRTAGTAASPALGSASGAPGAAATSGLSLAVPHSGLSAGAEHGPLSYEEGLHEKRACYRLLERVHSLLPPTDPPRVKDYIAFPKSNGYSSLHSTVFLRGYPVEIAVRTEWMERVAEHGMAASWLARVHKEDCSVRLPWLREAQLEADASSRTAATGEACGDAYAASIRQSLQGAVGRRFVFTSQGTILNLCGNATVRDAALELHDARKMRVVAAKVNSRLVGLNHPLKDGDVVSVITAPYPAGAAPPAAAAAASAASLAAGTADAGPLAAAGHDAPAPRAELGVGAAGGAASPAMAAGSGNSASSDDASSEAYALGAVHVQLVRSSVWPWSLIGSDDDAGAPGAGGSGRSALVGAVARAGLLGANRPPPLPAAASAPLQPPPKLSQEPPEASRDTWEKWVAASADEAAPAAESTRPLAVAATARPGRRRRRSSGAGAADGDNDGSDAKWYELAEVKHGRMSMAFAAALLVDAVVERGPALGPTAAGVHGSPIVHLYSMTPSQLIPLVVAVGCIEFAGGVWTSMLGDEDAAAVDAAAAAATGGGVSGGLFGGGGMAGLGLRRLRLFEAALGPEAERRQGGLSLRAAVGETARTMASSEVDSGRLAMVGLLALVVQALVQGDDTTLGHALGVL